MLCFSKFTKEEVHYENAAGFNFGNLVWIHK